jgi:hypothetical protein
VTPNPIETACRESIFSLPMLSIRIDAKKRAAARGMTCERRLATWHRLSEDFAAVMILARRRNTL